MEATLHYLYDPLCGWCYGASPLVAALQRQAGGRLRLQMHGGGLFAPTRLPASSRDYIRQADARIGELTGQPFGAAYLNGLLADPQTLYDSQPPIAAILAAESLMQGSGPAMLRAIQHAHYVEGRRIVESDVLASLADSVGLAEPEFRRAYGNNLGAKTQAHIVSTRQLMDRTGVHGFPGFVLQQDEQWRTIAHETRYGQPAEFVGHVLGCLN